MENLTNSPNVGERRMIYETFDRILAGDDVETVVDFVHTYHNAHIRRYMRTNVIRRVRSYIKTNPRTGGNR